MIIRPPIPLALLCLSMTMLGGCSTLQTMFDKPVADFQLDDADYMEAVSYTHLTLPTTPYV